MTWYAETGPLRTRQLLLDLAAALWVLLWLRLGATVHDTVGRLAAPGRELEQAGAGRTACGAESTLYSTVHGVTTVTPPARVRLTRTLPAARSSRAKTPVWSGSRACSPAPVCTSTGPATGPNTWPVSDR